VEKPGSRYQDFHRGMQSVIGFQFKVVLLISYVGFFFQIFFRKLHELIFWVVIY